MPRPGLSFEVARSGQPVLGVRSDRGAMPALLQRGPVDRAVLVEGKAEFERVFGSPVLGMLGARAARAYFANGGVDLVVSRVRSPLSTSAAGEMPLTGVSGATSFALRLRDPGAYGNGTRLVGAPTVARRVEGTTNAAGTRLDFGPAPTSDVDLPLLVSNGLTTGWARIVGADATGYLITPLPGLGSASVSATVYRTTFAIRIVEHDRPDVLVEGLALNELETFEGTPLEPVGSPLAGSGDIPPAGASVALTGGTDGLDIAGLSPPALAVAEAELASAFRVAFDALDASELPDIVFCADLWSRVFQTKGIARLALTAASSRSLAVDLVRRASRIRDRVVVLDPPLVRGGDTSAASAIEVLSWRAELGAELGEERDFAAAYAPWVRTLSPDLRHRGDDTLIEPPSPFVAGRMARTALTRGAWISTGNVALEGVVGSALALSAREEEDLLDAGVDPLRVSSAGVTIQGVRSLAWPDRLEWGFLSARRLFNYLRRALGPIGSRYVFEPNGPATWAQLRRDLEALLRDLFARGAFAGASTREAYFVRCDASLNPEDARESGVLTAQIGVAPAAPLEFLVVRLVATRDASVVLEEGA